VVAEAGPLVFLEALAAGCFPMGTYFGGMAASIDAVSGALPPVDARLMRLRNDPAHTVADIAANAAHAFDLGGKHAAALRRVAVERYDWRIAARRLADGLTAL
jgi:glycosyltransferase involved in cell wall biosynthesis